MDTVREFIGFYYVHNSKIDDLLNRTLNVLN